MGPTNSSMCSASAACDGVRNATTVLVWSPLPMKTNSTGKGGKCWVHTIRIDLLSWAVVACTFIPSAWEAEAWDGRVSLS